VEYYSVKFGEIAASLFEISCGKTDRHTYIGVTKTRKEAKRSWVMVWIRATVAAFCFLVTSQLNAGKKNPTPLLPLTWL